MSWVSAGLAVLSSLPALLVLTALLFWRGTLCLFFLFIFLYILFYIMVSVFFPHFCTGLLLRGCYM